MQHSDLVGGFESDVISDGTQTRPAVCEGYAEFESDVISDGTQTVTLGVKTVCRFESDVISDGTQTKKAYKNRHLSLRVM